MNKDVMATVTKVLFYLLAAGLLVWTSSMTLAFVGNALPHLTIARFFALIVFDVGAVAWLLIYLYSAEGTPQRATALILSIFDLLGVGLMVFAELFTGGQTITDIPADLGAVALWSIGIWTLANLLGVFAFHLGDQETMHRIAQRGASDKIKAKALKLLEARTDEISDQVAAELARRMVGETLLSLDAGSMRDVIPAIARDVTPASVPAGAPTNGTAAANGNGDQRKANPGANGLQYVRMGGGATNGNGKTAANPTSARKGA